MTTGYNGKLNQWIQVLKSGGNCPMPICFVDFVGTLKIFLQYIIHIINGLLKALSFIHKHNILHKNVHDRSILMHFGRKLYVGLVDYCRARIIHQQRITFLFSARILNQA